MNNNPRCLYNNGFDKFINEDANIGVQGVQTR